MLRRLLFVFVLLWLQPTLAWADPTKRISQYAHAVWRVQDGALSSAPRVITQTADGYLWIGSSTGLLRFDGVRLAPWAPSDGAWASAAPDIYALLGAHDGSLWIGGGPGYLGRVKDGRLTNYARVGEGVQ